jgi:hypothetical protein
MLGLLLIGHGPAPPGPAEVQSAFSSLPEGKSYDDKFAFVVTDRNGNLLGHLELIRDCPTTGEWWLGLTLLAPNVRSQGLGTEVHDAATEWVRNKAAAGFGWPWLRRTSARFASGSVSAIGKSNERALGSSDPKSTNWLFYAKKSETRTLRWSRDSPSNPGRSERGLGRAAHTSFALGAPWAASPRLALVIQGAA